MSDDIQAIQTLFDLSPYGDEGDALINNVVQARVRTCMASKGFEYSIVPHVPRGDVADAIGLVPPIPDLAEVASLGYGAAKRRELATPPPERARADQENKSRSEDKQWTKAIFGDDDGDPGCRLQAEESVVADANLQARDLYTSIVPDIISALSIASTLKSSEKMRQANVEWSACMSDRGMPYASPTESTARFPNGPKPTPEEVQTATADFECRREVRFNETLLESLADRARAWAEDHEGQIIELRATTKQDIERVSALRQ